VTQFTIYGRANTKLQFYSRLDHYTKSTAGIHTTHTHTHTYTKHNNTVVILDLYNTIQYTGIEHNIAFYYRNSIDRLISRTLTYYNTTIQIQAFNDSWSIRVFQAEYSSAKRIKSNHFVFIHSCSILSKHTYNRTYCTYHIDRT
jgi:hypothetical protein